MSTYNILYVLLVFSFALSSAAMWINWRLNPHEDVVRDWAISLSLILVGCAFSVAARLQLPDEQSMADVNIYTLLRDLGITINGLAWLIIWSAMRRFMGRSPVKTRNIAIYTFVFALFVVAAHPLRFAGAWGVACISVLVSVCSALILYELLKPRRGGAAIWISGLGFSIAVVSWGIRAVISIINLERAIDNDFDNLVMFGAVISAYACMFGLVLLTNQRLIDQLDPGLPRDQQTGMLNINSFSELTENLMIEAKTIGLPCCLVRISLDNVEDIAYEYDTDSVSLALRQIASSSIQVLGRNDLFCRYNRNEFLFFLYGKTEPLAFSSVFRLKTFLEQHVIETRAGAFRINISLGVAQWDMQESLSELVQKTSISIEKSRSFDQPIIAQSVTYPAQAQLG